MRKYVLITISSLLEQANRQHILNNEYSPNNNFFLCINAESATDAASRPHKPFHNGVIGLSEYGRYAPEYEYIGGNGIDEIPGLFNAKFQNITHFEGFPSTVDMLIGENCINNVEANDPKKHLNKNWVIKLFQVLIQENY